MTQDSVKVLLVDDDEDCYVITRDVLADIEHARFDLEWQPSYETGLEACQRNGHDVCLIDYRLGKQDGLELMQAARAKGCKTPMILMTGQGDHELDMEAMKAGAADYLVKGRIDAPMMERSIRYAIDRTRTLASLRESQAQLLKMNEDLKKTNDQLQAAQLTLMNADKMELVGRLAAGVAHEVKNPLAVIAMGVEYLTTDFPDKVDGNVKIALQQMHDSVQRADTIIRGLLDFSASSRWDAKEEDLNSLIEQSLQLTRHDLMKSHVLVEKRLGEGLPPLKLNRTKIEQVFINLFINATHAMAKGGTLSVRTYVQPAHTHGNGNGDSPSLVMAEVADSGTGIPPEVLPRIFEPFFTTKPTGVGTGLGLSVVKNIVELHGGAIQLANRPEGGAQATITFPIERKP